MCSAARCITYIHRGFAITGWRNMGIGLDGPVQGTQAMREATQGKPVYTARHRACTDRRHVAGPLRCFPLFFPCAHRRLPVQRLSGAHVCFSFIGLHLSLQLSIWWEIGVHQLAYIAPTSPP